MGRGEGIAVREVPEKSRIPTQTKPKVGYPQNRRQKIEGRKAGPKWGFGKNLCMIRGFTEA